MESSESKKQRGAVRRQQSMVERGSGRMYFSPQHHQQPSHNNGQDYYEYQQQQYHNYYNQHHPRPGYYPSSHDERYLWQQRHERFYPGQEYYNETEPIYGNYNQPPRMRPMEEGIYANRALIELERPIEQSSSRLVRRHSLNERRNIAAFATLTKRKPKHNDELNDRLAQLGIEEPIYQSQRGSYMYHEQMKHRPEFHRPFVVDENERIMRTRVDARSLENSSTPSPSSMPSPSKDKSRDPQRMLKEQIYQSRMNAMVSMAEPIYISKSSSGTSTNTGRSLRSQPIYESKRETENDDNHDVVHRVKAEIDTSNENNETTDEKSLLEDIEDTIKRKLSVEMLNETRTTETDESTTHEDSEEHQIPFADNDTQESERNETAATDEKTNIEQELKSPGSRPKFLGSYHISNIIKMHAPPPPPIRSPTTKKSFEPEKFESQTSMDTNCTSQTSLSIGLPNAQSTPFTSELTLKDQNAKSNFLTTTANNHQLRPPITKRGIFDENGGILEDKTWNVTLIIPPNALKSQQEIYFTVSDPRMSKTVGGPPLDMENGWFHIYILCTVLFHFVDVIYYFD